MARPNRGVEQEIADIENWLTDIYDDLELLAGLVERCTTDACRREFAARIASKRRRFDELRKRRQNLQRQLR